MHTDNYKAQLKKPSILIVDNVPRNLQILATILSKEDYLIAAATSGRQALEMIDKVVPDLILLDIMMPDMDGFEICKKIKKSEKTKHMPIIFITAKHETKDIIEGFRSGAVDYVIKPYNSDELLARVSTHMELKKQKDTIIQINEQLMLEIKLRMEVEESLRNEKDRVEKYLNTAGALIMVIDSKGTVTLVNKTGCRILGYIEEEIIGKNYFDTFIPSKLREKIRKKFRQIIEGKTDFVEYSEHPVVTKDRRRRVLGWHNTLLYDEQGRTSGMVTSGVDITEIKHAERERMHREKLQGVLEMAGAVCHELNQPLQSISGYSELLLKHLLPGDEMYERIIILKNQVDAMGEITKKLMRITKYETREYIAGKKIIDIDKASKDAKPYTY